MKHEKIYLVTDGCMWEINEKLGDEHPHAMEVVDMETGAVRYIRSGSRIAFIEGYITDIRTQKAYSKATSKKGKKMPTDGEAVPDRASSKTPRTTNKHEGV